ncbi:calcium/sodium antiporter [Aliiglaciecola sp. CAU 1673]|uniref:calcium/sodium antiporter n=1 Tax=Aliiglaciecola sp. CAU 1673 TaxID=3032595 RepID=UPI0023DAC9AB|nr:calcium/sodium antiporter [Aliiglaciecola sp. CAU 1673]MDF2178471.1 calcium/sodium antiporter [Aliiglaciecola sp. CAU 1673]
MLTQAFIFFSGLVVLSWSANRFILGASALARIVGVSPMIIGLTIVAMGSSAPEIMVAASAAMSGRPDTAVGNAIGSNIANIALVLGITTLLKPLKVSSSTLRREMPLVLMVSVLATWLLWDLQLTRSEGVVLLVLFFITIGLLIRLSLRTSGKDPLSRELQEEVPERLKPLHAIFWLLLGLFLLPLSAHYMVASAVFIAAYFGVSDLVIGLTIIAIGTSLPELAACVAGVIRKEQDLALGNILGSNIFNILAVLAMPGIIAPDSIDAGVRRDLLIMLALTSLLLFFGSAIRGRRRIERWHGGILLMSFAAYQISLFP